MDFFTAKQAADYLNVTPNTIRNWDKENRIPVYKDPKTNYRLYKKEDLDAMKLPQGIQQTMVVEKTPTKIESPKRLEKKDTNHHHILLRLPKETLSKLDEFINNYGMGKPSRTSVVLMLINRCLSD